MEKKIGFIGLGNMGIGIAKKPDRSRLPATGLQSHNLKNRRARQ